MNKAIKLILISCFLTGCSRNDAIAASNTMATSYLESNKNNIVKNWQAKVASTPTCSEFKNKFLIVGNRYTDAVNGAFNLDMMQIWELTKSAGCAAPL